MNKSNPDHLPMARTADEDRPTFPLIWLVPLVAALVGLGLGLQAILNSGPVITIAFDTAEGIEEGKTKVRFKNVDIGEVTDISLSQDRSKVIVTAEFAKDASDFLVEDTQFWVVRPRISGGEVSGVGTLFSGSFIALKAGDSDRTVREFQGLETAPILTSRMAGRGYVLSAKDLGSLDVGAPIYYRHIRVGEVTTYELEQNGLDVHLQIFIHAPYDRFVKPDSRFWNASGFDLSVDSKGARLDTESLVSILSGGIAFETPENSADQLPADPMHEFALSSDRMTAMKTWRGKPTFYRAEFTDSLKGLTQGALIEFRGIPVGEVKSVEIHYDAEGRNFAFPVTLAVYEEELGASLSDLSETEQQDARQKTVDNLVSLGLRAQIRSTNMLLGTRYIALEFFPNTQAFKLDWTHQPVELPTMPGAVEELEQNFAHILKNVNQIPFDQIGKDTKDTLETLNRTTQNLNLFIDKLNRNIAPETQATLIELRKSLTEVKETLAPDAPLQRDLRRTLEETTRSVRSIKGLADTLEREPESLLRGKAGDPD